MHDFLIWLFGATFSALVVSAPWYLSYKRYERNTDHIVALHNIETKALAAKIVYNQDQYQMALDSLYELTMYQGSGGVAQNLSTDLLERLIAYVRLGRTSAYADTARELNLELQKIKISATYANSLKDQEINTLQTS